MFVEHSKSSQSNMYVLAVSECVVSAESYIGNANLFLAVSLESIYYCTHLIALKFSVKRWRLCVIYRSNL